MNKDILFVCTGNTCRSPMAMAIFNAVSKEERAHSAGLQVPVASGAAENARIAAEEYGACLDGHISRQITLDDLKSYSRIITMTASQKQILRSIYDDEKIITLAEFAGESKDISDPYGGNLEIYRNTAKMIYEYIKKGMQKEECVFATANDTEQIEEIEKQCFPDAWSKDAIEREINRERIFVIKNSGRILGYCIIMIAADEGEILRIAVDKDMRRRGVAKRLIEAATEKMKTIGCKSLFLEVRASNSAAISLYESVGFQQSGIRKSYYRDNNEDALLYRLEIKER